MLTHFSVQTSQGPLPFAGGTAALMPTSPHVVKAKLASSGANLAELRSLERSYLHFI